MSREQIPQYPLNWFELAGVSWSEFAAGTLQAQLQSLSALVLLRNSYPHILMKVFEAKERQGRYLREITP